MSGVGQEPDGATPLDPDEREGLRFRHVRTRGELNELEQANIQFIEYAPTPPAIPKSVPISQNPHE